jgi:hypothetical protein
MPKAPEQSFGEWYAKRKENKKWAAAKTY